MQYKIDKKMILEATARSLNLQHRKTMEAVVKQNHNLGEDHPTTKRNNELMQKNVIASANQPPQPKKSLQEAGVGTLATAAGIGAMAYGAKKGLDKLIPKMQSHNDALNDAVSQLPE